MAAAGAGRGDGYDSDGSTYTVYENDFEAAQACLRKTEIDARSEGLYLLLQGNRDLSNFEPGNLGYLLLRYAVSIGKFPVLMRAVFDLTDLIDSNRVSALAFSLGGVSLGDDPAAGLPRSTK